MKLYFSQQHIDTQHLGRSLLIENTPHYQFLAGHEERYKDYLMTSWGYYFPKYKLSSIQKQIQKYKALIESVKKDGIQQPIEIFQRLNGDWMIYDGNHRASIALYYDLEIPTKEMSLEEAIRRRVINPKSFYGSKHRNMPYQTIYSPDRQKLVQGRRDDILLRNSLIDMNDVKGLSVLDVGCNYGGGLFLLKDASRRIGLDIDKDILTSAVRLSVIFDEPVNFHQHDLNDIYVDLSDVHTAFVFSVHKHLRRLDGLKHVLKNKVSDVAYIETHEKELEIPTEIAQLFSRVELKGKIGERSLFRCEK